MKNRKIIYTIITLVFAIGFYLYDNYSVKSITTNNAESSKNTSISDFDYLPTSTTNQLIHHNYYSLSYNEKYEQAEWVAYELDKNQLSNSNFKRPYFELDSKVTTKSAHYKNFKNSGYNKGHLCPAGDRKFSKEAFNETFLTSNISPQLYDFNGGIWNRLEQKVRYWAQKYDHLYIVTGGVLTNDLKTIGTEKVAVPNYFYKIILDYSEPEIKAIAFLIPHQESEKGLYQFVTSIDKIEELTGIDFFPALPDSLENKLEKSSSYINWSLR
ncbi:DNA/RNA non-specific endonuclease [Lutibacter sp.]|uniref:DNA/RNA non-specific endonuclease n=1 Tax=Lutibacter sp. TaxID=1925666 RepID=UPI003563D0FD